VRVRIPSAPPLLTSGNVQPSCRRAGPWVRNGCQHSTQCGGLSVLKRHQDRRRCNGGPRPAPFDLVDERHQSVMLALCRSVPVHPTVVCSSSPPTIWCWVVRRWIVALVEPLVAWLIESANAQHSSAGSSAVGVPALPIDRHRDVVLVRQAVSKQRGSKHVQQIDSVATAVVPADLAVGDVEQGTFGLLELAPIKRAALLIDTDNSSVAHQALGVGLLLGGVGCALFPERLHHPTECAPLAR
jgi:hypothetical protein